MVAKGVYNDVGVWYCVSEVVEEAGGCWLTTFLNVVIAGAVTAASDVIVVVVSAGCFLPFFFGCFFLGCFLCLFAEGSGAPGVDVDAAGVCVTVAICVTVVLRVGVVDTARSACEADVVMSTDGAAIEVEVLATAGFLGCFLCGLFFFGFCVVVD